MPFPFPFETDPLGWSGGSNRVGQGIGLGSVSEWGPASSGVVRSAPVHTTDFFDIVTIQNDQISYVNHVVDPLCVFFTLFGCWRGYGGFLSDFVTG